jgi:REP element-mobilizing transposase RayT
MASTLTRVLVHITFSTKQRAPMIPESIEAELAAYIGGICRRKECTLVAMGGTADHVHLLVDLSKKVALSDLLLDIKRDTSRWIKDVHADLAAFAWQEGYFAFSIGESAVDAVRAYFADQKRHHARRGFQDEMRELFRKYGIECDERYVWT